MAPPGSERSSQATPTSLWRLEPVVTHQPHRDPTALYLVSVHTTRTDLYPTAGARFPSALLAAAEPHSHHQQSRNMMKEKVPFSVSAH